MPQDKRAPPCYPSPLLRAVRSALEPRRRIVAGCLAAGVAGMVFHAASADQRFPAVLDLAALDGSNGFELRGAPTGVSSGAAVSGAGDVNGDSFDDLIIGAPAPDGGTAHVVFGGPAVGSSGQFDLAALAGTNGFVLVNRARPEPSSPTFSHLGAHVAGIADVNGDGFDDITADAPSADRYNNYSGAAFIVFGGDDGFPPRIESWTLDGTRGFIESVQSDDFTSSVSAAAGDVNGDGFDDLLVGRAAPILGEAYILFGGPRVASAPRARLRMPGRADEDRTGFAVAGGDDINGDGFADVVVAAPNFDADPRGAVYVVFGSGAMGGDDTLDLSSLDGMNGFAMLGASDNVSLSLGDVNGDDFADIVIGAQNLAPNGMQSGGAFVVFGSDERFPATIDLTSLDGEMGFLIEGAAAYDFAGTSVSAAGDLTGDGINDIAIGAPRLRGDRNLPGTSYVVFGGPRLGRDGVLELSSIDGVNGFELRGTAPLDFAGTSVSAAGDTDSDGIGDLIIGAPGTSGGVGASFLVFGKEIDTTPPTCTASAKPATLWPPNHRLVDVSIAVAVDGKTNGANFKLVSVASNEKDWTARNGDVKHDLQDWQPGTPDIRGRLRAERDPHGRDRVYTLTYRVTGGETCKAAVVVPHDRGSP